jgi:hypothetical protein
VPRVDQRNTIWMVVFVVALVIGGLCAVGFWQTYDMKCGAFGSGGKTWTWTEFPPKYKCNTF